MVYKQRAEAQLLKKKADWRTIQSRQQTEAFLPIHTFVKAGASISIAERVATSLTPHFDPNRNDIWSKRLNTLRRFVSLVSRWLIRKRVTDRIGKIRETFLNNGAISREEVLAFIERENLAYRKSGGKNTLLKPSSNNTSTARVSTSNEVKLSESDAIVKSQQDAGTPAPVSVAAMVFTSTNEIQLTREFNESVLQKSAAGEIMDFNPQMIRRILFPKSSSNGNGAGSRKAIPPPDLRKTLLQFNDKTFYQLKVRPEFVTMGYGTLVAPASPVFYPPNTEKTLRKGAPEELFLRPAADSKVPVEDLNKLLNDSPSEASVPKFLKDLRVIKLDIPVQGEVVPSKGTDESSGLGLPENGEPPLWLSAEAEWKPAERDFFRALPEYRMLVQAPRRCEIDVDWILRPNLSAEKLIYQPDSSLRTRFAGTNSLILVK